MNEYSYAIEKLTNVLACLAVHPGDVRERLKAIFPEFSLPREADFPQECRQEWLSIIKALTKSGPVYKPDGDLWLSSVENTMRHIQNRTASRIAKQVYDLYWHVSENKQYR
jgi:hypothetical protein